MMGALSLALGSDTRSLRVFRPDLLLLLAALCSLPDLLEASSRGRFLDSENLSPNETNELSNPKFVYSPTIRSELGSGDFTEELPLARLAYTEEEQSHSRRSPSKLCYRSRALPEDPPPDDPTPDAKNAEKEPPSN